MTSTRWSEEQEKKILQGQSRFLYFALERLNSPERQDERLRKFGIKDISKNKIATMLNASSSTVKKWFDGDSGISRKYAQDLARILCLPNTKFFVSLYSSPHEILRRLDEIEREEKLREEGLPDDEIFQRLIDGTLLDKPQEVKKLTTQKDEISEYFEGSPPKVPPEYASGTLLDKVINYLKLEGSFVDAALIAAVLQIDKVEQLKPNARLIIDAIRNEIIKSSSQPKE